MGRGLSSEEIGRKKLHGPGQILEYAVAQVDILVGPPVSSRHHTITHIRRQQQTD